MRWPISQEKVPMIWNLLGRLGFLFRYQKSTLQCPPKFVSWRVCPCSVASHLLVLKAKSALATTSARSKHKVSFVWLRSSVFEYLLCLALVLVVLAPRQQAFLRNIFVKRVCHRYPILSYFDLWNLSNSINLSNWNFQLCFVTRSRDH